jgi:hypothetical protein
VLTVELVLQALVVQAGNGQTLALAAGKHNVEERLEGEPGHKHGERGGVKQLLSGRDGRQLEERAALSRGAEEEQSIGCQRESEQQEARA